jgi:hypothetical protein
VRDVEKRVWREAARMALELIGIFGLIVAPLVLFGAAAKWGIDSRFMDVRSDF